MPYNLTIVGENTTGLLTFTQAVNNELMSGWFGVLILVGICTILFMSFQFRTQEVGKSLAATAFLCFGLSLFLKAVNLIPNLALFIALVAAAGMLAFSFKA